MSQTWNSEFIAQLQMRPMQDIQALFALREMAKWPNAEGLNRLKNKGLAEAKSMPRFVCQNHLAPSSAYYEQIIAEQGVIPTRPESWHDLFNGLMWLQFPSTKTLLNQLHVSDITEFGLSPRTQRRNQLTHFDECGVVLACSEPALLDLLRNHQWHEVFVENRASWGRDIHAHIIGHANYELLLSPFIGLTGKWLAVNVDKGFAQLSLAAKNDKVDKLLVAKITEQDVFSQARALLPIPLLGIPTWWEANQDETFYRDTDYFRAKR